MPIDDNVAFEELLELDIINSSNFESSNFFPLYGINETIFENIKDRVRGNF